MSKNSEQWELKNDAELTENLENFDNGLPKNSSDEFGPQNMNSIHVQSQYYLWRKVRKPSLENFEVLEEEKRPKRKRKAPQPDRAAVPTENEYMWEDHIEEEMRISKQLGEASFSEEDEQAINELLKLTNAHALTRAPDPWDREGFYDNCDDDDAYDAEEQFALYGTHLDNEYDEPIPRPSRRKRTAQRQTQNHDNQSYFHGIPTAKGAGVKAACQRTESNKPPERHVKVACDTPQKTMEISKHAQLTNAAAIAATFLLEHTKSLLKEQPPAAGCSNSSSPTRTTHEPQHSETNKVTYLSRPKRQVPITDSSSSNTSIRRQAPLATKPRLTLHLTHSSECSSKMFLPKQEQVMDPVPETSLHAKRMEQQRRRAEATNISSTEESIVPPCRSKQRFLCIARSSSSSKHSERRPRGDGRSKSSKKLLGSSNKSFSHKTTIYERQKAGAQHNSAQAKSCDNGGRCCQSGPSPPPRPMSESCQPGCTSCCATGSRRSDNSFSPQFNSTMVPRQQNRSSCPDSCTKNRKPTKCEKPPTIASCSQCSKDADVTSYFVPAEVLCGSDQDLMQYASKEKTQTTNDAIASIKCRLPPKEWQKILFDNFVRDRYCPGTIQDTVDGVINFNAIMIEMMREKIGTIPKDPGPYEPWSLIEAFSLRIDHERCQVRHYSADGNMNETADIEAHFQRQKPTCLNRAISSLLKAERLFEINSPPPRDLFDIHVNRADVLLPNKTVQLVLLTGTTTPV